MQSSKWTAFRLKPVADPLEACGFVSKGDKKLLDPRAQADYYEKIIDRYMQFCAHHRKDLDAAFASLPVSASADATTNPPATAPTSTAKQAHQHGQDAAAELSTLLLALRKLREAILATASTTPIIFSQRVHMFSIKLSIRAQHPPSYFPSLRRLLETLHSRAHPLPDSELMEFSSFLILDYACRQADLAAAFKARADARRNFNFRSSTVDDVLAALMHGNWVVLWQTRKGVNSYMRALINWAEDRVRRHALQAVGSAYYDVHVQFVLEGCTGDGDKWTWETLKERENILWEKEGDKVIIKRAKKRAEKKLAPINENV